MFDAKKLLDQLIAGGSQQHSQSAAGGAGGGLGDLLGQLAGAMQGGQKSGGSGGGLAGGGLAGGLGDLLGKLAGGQSGGQAAGQSGGAQAGSGSELGGIGDLLRQFTGGTDTGAGQGAGSGAAAQSDSDGGLGAGLGAGLGDLLGKLQSQAGQSGQEAGQAGQEAGQGGQSADAGGSGSGGGTGSSGNITDVLGQILGQATSGVKEGAGRISDATGAGDALKNITGGRSGDELLAQLKDLIANNKLGAGAVAGGLGALVLGTQTGRGLAASAAKLGGLAMIGGLAYKAYQNYQAGRPLINTAETDTEAAPDGSGFEAQAVSNDAATVYIRAMIAAAAADGRIDDAEQQKIIGSLGEAGLDEGAQQFLRREFANPASVEDLADGVSTSEERVQVFTAARMAIDFDNVEEQQFLMSLAGALDLAPELVQHIDAAARASAAA